MLFLLVIFQMRVQYLTLKPAIGRFVVIYNLPLSGEIIIVIRQFVERRFITRNFNLEVLPERKM